MIQVRCSDQQILLPVHVTPKSNRDEILPFGPGDTEVKLKVSSLPEDGKANAAVEKLLAKAFGLAKNRLQVVRGEKSRNKQVKIAIPSVSEIDPLLARLGDRMGQGISFSEIFIQVNI